MIKKINIFVIFLIAINSILTFSNENSQTELEEIFQKKLNGLYWLEDSPNLIVKKDLINTQKSEKFISELLENWETVSKLLYNLKLDSITLENINIVSLSEESNTLSINLLCEEEKNCLSMDAFIQLLKSIETLKSSNELDVQTPITFAILNAELFKDVKESEKVMKALPLLAGYYPNRLIQLDFEDIIINIAGHESYSGIRIDTQGEMKVIQSVLNGEKFGEFDIVFKKYNVSYYNSYNIPGYQSYYYPPANFYNFSR